ncbi:MAG TPA: hypothetical protein VMO26_11655 [Vicinamibacterales bacterium]|nr:hypothetical protein [Vicinamibacterales bacterium]
MQHYVVAFWVRFLVPSFIVRSLIVPSFLVPSFVVPSFLVRFVVLSFVVPFFVLSSSFLVLSAQAPAPGTVVELRAVGGLLPETCNVFRDPATWQQAPSGDYFVFDRRDHSVYRIPRGGRTPAKIVSIGGEGGRLLEPTAFDLAPNGRTFAVADAPRGQERLQVFDAGGTWLTGFFLPGRARTRVSISGLALGGVSTLTFLGNGLVLNQPETGSLITEYGLGGTPVRSIGALRPTGHEDDRQLHLALNTGIPLPHPGGGYYFVFLSGTPVFRRYDAKGGLVFERVMQGRELDPIVEQMPNRWPRRTVDGTELPLVVPHVRTAAVDRRGSLWVAFLTPFTYVFDDRGDKVRTVQFRATGIIAPSSLVFSTTGSLLVTPGCYEFPAG